MGAGPCFGTWVPPPVAPPPHLQDSLVRVYVYWLDESSPCPASTSTLDFTSLFQFPWGQGQGGGGQGQRESGWGGLSGGPWVSGTPPGQSPTLSSAGVKENLCPPCASLCPQGFWAWRRGRGAPVDRGSEACSGLGSLGEVVEASRSGVSGPQKCSRPRCLATLQPPPITVTSHPTWATGEPSLLQLTFCPSLPAISGGRRSASPSGGPQCLGGE